MSTIWKSLFALLMAPVVLVAGWVYSAKAPDKEIAAVTIQRASLLQGQIHKADLVNGEYWKFEGEFLGEGAELTFVSELSDKKVETFQKAAKRYGMAGWPEYNFIAMVIGGPTPWYVTITFTDGTKMSTYCYSYFPLTFAKVAKAFEELTSAKILT